MQSPSVSVPCRVLTMLNVVTKLHTGLLTNILQETKTVFLQMQKGFINMDWIRAKCEQNLSSVVSVMKKKADKPGRGIMLFGCTDQSL